MDSDDEMIRKVTEADIPGITFLMKSEPGFWKQVPPPDPLERELDSAGDLAFVWEENHQIVGFVCAHDLGFRAYLSELIVAESVRGRGIGQQLLRHVQNEVTTPGCSVLISDVWRSAEPFYRSLGWSEPDATLLSKNL